MIDDSKYIFRDATIADIDFLVETVIQSEKSSANKCGMANLFGMSEVDFRHYLRKMFEEEIDGCELSVSSFIIVEYEGQAVATLGGFLEGGGEDQMPSSILKSNLLQYIMPASAMQIASENIQIAKELSIERQQGTYQFEYTYVLREHQGQMLMHFLIEKHFEKAEKLGVKKIQAHVFEGNKGVILIEQMMGFKIIKKIKAQNPRVLEFYPFDTLLLLEKEI